MMIAKHHICWLAVLALVACRGGIKKEPPVHLVLDMDNQPKIKAQNAFPFPGWTDQRGMRMPLEGTVARGELDDDELASFQAADGSYVSNPLPATLETVRRGQNRFDIYCAVCHTRSGDQKGIVLLRANEGAFNPSPPQLSQDERLRTIEDGHLFETISNGRNTMPGYAAQIDVRDRWAIVHYLRALQTRFE